MPKEPFSNIFLRFLIESYLELLLVSLINIEYFASIGLIFTNISDTFAFVLGTINGVFAIGLPLFVVMKVALKIDILEMKIMDPSDYVEIADRKMNKNYGTLFDGLKEHCNLSLNHHYIYLMRRLVFVLTALYMDKYTFF